MTNAILAQIIGGILAGLVLLFVTQKYFSEPRQAEIRPLSQQTATVIPNESGQAAEPPLNKAEKIISSETRKQSRVTTDAALPKVEVALQEEADTRKAERELQAMVQEKQEKKSSLSKDKKVNTEAEHVQARADDAFSELDSSTK